MGVVGEQRGAHAADDDVEDDRERDLHVSGADVRLGRTKKHAAIVFMPVRSETVAEAPVMSIEDTIRFVAMAKKPSVAWPAVPQRALTTCRNVVAYGVCILSLAAFMAKSLVRQLDRGRSSRT